MIAPADHDDDQLSADFVRSCRLDKAICIECRASRTTASDDLLPPAYRLYCSACCDARYTGGLSYLKPSEAAALHPVAYRPDLEPRAADAEDLQRINRALERELRSISAPVSVVSKNRLKQYLLLSEQRSLLNGRLLPAEEIRAFADLRFHLAAKNSALVLHLRYEKAGLLRASEGLEDSDVQLVLLSYDTAKAVTSSNPHRLCLELFVDSGLWSRLPAGELRALKFFQILAEDLTAGKIRDRRLSKLRDGPRLELVSEDKIVERNGRRVVETRWFFPPGREPKGYAFSQPVDELGRQPVGVITYGGLYTERELAEIERLIKLRLIAAPEGSFSAETAQKMVVGKRVPRTKFFFGARYLWGKQQQGHGKSSAAPSVRADVDAPPDWLRDLIERPMVRVGLIASADFVNSWAVNVYHDGSVGLHQHLDNVEDFERPIFSLRLFSPSRLSFDARGVGMNDPLFFISMPRGGITVMEDGGFAANAVTHCVRPADMAGLSAAVILRRIRPHVLAAAQKQQQQQQQKQ